MESPIHPIDEALRSLGWRRARLEDVKEGESQKVAARCIFLATSAGLSGRRMITSFDFNFWTEGGRVRMEFPTTPPLVVQAMMEPLMAQDDGVSPDILGLVPCLHGQHWTPYCVPLIWQQPMNKVSTFGGVVQQYAVHADDSAWQCPDVEPLIRLPH